MRVEVSRPPWLSRDHPRQADVCGNAPAGLAAAGHSVRLVAEPTWTSEWVVMWGLGHPEGQRVLRQAREAGVHVIGFDLGYWCRTDPHRKFRMAVDDHHPGVRLMAKRRPASRLEADGIVLREDSDSSGPVVLVGMGYKSAATYSEEPGAWEKRTLSKIRRAWPGRQVVFRPKPGGGDHRPAGVPVVGDTGIEVVLRGASAIYCRQSNVAVDAIIAGVPAIAEEGAASAVCDRDLRAGHLPSKLSVELRREFLANLAWFQWSGAELRRAGTWKVIEDIVRSAEW